MPQIHNSKFKILKLKQNPTPAPQVLPLKRGDVKYQHQREPVPFVRGRAKRRGCQDN